MSKTKKRLKSWWKGQWLSQADVVPCNRYDPINKRMYFDSSAGCIEVRFKDRKLVAAFRDRYANRFIAIEPSDFKAFSKLYKEMQAEKIKGIKVIKVANLHTRLKGKLCNLLMF